MVDGSDMKLRKTLCALVLVTATAAADDRPNILFIMADDHASHAIGAYGSVINETPNIDRLAAGGMRFNNCFVTNSICAPSRAVILTGKYSHINGLTDNRVTFDGSQPTLPKVLQQAGYQTAIIGKWHLKSEPTGFEYHDVLPGQGDYHDPDMLRMGERVKHEGYVTDIITDLTLDWLKDHDPDKPFFLMSHHKAPHMAWEPDDKHAKMYHGEELPAPKTMYADHLDHVGAIHRSGIRMANINFWMKWPFSAPEGERHLLNLSYQYFIRQYLQTIASIDDNVGRLLDYLRETGLDKNTIVVYTSDQGFFLGDHGLFDKRFMYEQALRMPLIIRYPPLVPPGSVNNEMVLNLDFAATLAELARARPPDGNQGRSFVSLLQGATPGNWRTSMYYRYYETWLCPPHLGVRTDRYKLIHYYGLRADLQWELFDLQEDPDELHNLYHRPQYDSVIDDLKVEIAHLQQEYGDQPPQPRRR
jgi:arylsulfatase A-like enzyme